MANETPFARDIGFLVSASSGEVDLGCPLPSPALLLSTNIFSDDSWVQLGGESLWRLRFDTCPDGVKQAARVDVETILGNRTTGSNMETLQRLAESAPLCALMDAMGRGKVSPLMAQRTAALDGKVAIDTPLAQALAVRKRNAPSSPCHEVVVSSLNHEIKSITGYGYSDCYCYAHVGRVPYSCVAVGGVCLNVTGALGDTFHPLVPGKLVIYRAEWMGPWTVILCIIGAANTVLMIIFLIVSPITHALTTQNPAFWFLLANVVLEVIAIGMGWRLKHRWAMGWRKHLVRSDPFHALLTADGEDAIKVQWILGLEAAGGAASVVGLAFTSGVPLQVLSSLAVPVITSALAAYVSKHNGVRTPLIVGAMSFYLLEFLYEIVVLVILDDSVLGWVVIASCIFESMSLLWIIFTVLYALHFLSIKSGTQAPRDRQALLAGAPARIRDGTLAAFKLPDLPTGGLMGTSVLGSASLKPSFIEDGASAIKAGATSYRGWQVGPMPESAGWLSLESCGNTCLVDRTTFTGNHAWFGDIVVACGLAIPVVG